MRFLPLLAAAAASAAWGAPALKLEIVDRAAMPCPVDKLSVVAQPELALAPGEYEPLPVLVTASGAFEGKLRVSVPRGVEADIKIATPYRRKLRGNAEATEPFLLEAAPAISFQQAGQAVWWITLHANPDARPGRYAVTVRAGNASAKAALTVRPFRLRRDPSVSYGAFCGGKDTNITPAHLRDLHERGFDALQFFWPSLTVPVANDNGRMAVDFTAADRWMAAFRESGMKGPVVWSLGNYIGTATENMLSRVFDIPRPAGPIVRKQKYTVNISDIHNPELNRRLKELMLAIRDRAAERKWPELDFIIYDEPTMALMDEYMDRFRFIKSFWPELKIYGVVMDKLELAKQVGPYADIVSANGDFERIGAYCRENGKAFWFYGSASGQDEAAIRRRYAWTAWAHRAQSIWFWAYNYHADNPYDDFDGRGADSTMSMAWPPRQPDGPPVFSISWDGMREAIDDMAYIQTLEWMLGQSRSPRAGDIRAKLEEMRGRATVRERGDRDAARRFVTEGRREVAGWITELLGEEKGLYREIRIK